jgi:hypothetical protein
MNLLSTYGSFLRDYYDIVFFNNLAIFAHLELVEG